MLRSSLVSSQHSMYINPIVFTVAIYLVLLTPFSHPLHDTSTGPWIKDICSSMLCSVWWVVRDLSPHCAERDMSWQCYLLLERPLDVFMWLYKALSRVTIFSSWLVSLQRTEKWALVLYPPLQSPCVPVTKGSLTYCILTALWVLPPSPSSWHTPWDASHPHFTPWHPGWPPGCSRSSAEASSWGRQSYCFSPDLSFTSTFSHFFPFTFTCPIPPPVPQTP